MYLDKLYYSYSCRVEHFLTLDRVHFPTIRISRSNAVRSTQSCWRGKTAHLPMLLLGQHLATTQRGLLGGRGERRRILHA
eukprot:COSAG01_NODE_2924_length_6842_cov_3.862821_5_plen_80_part_00